MLRQAVDKLARCPRPPNRVRTLATAATTTPTTAYPYSSAVSFLPPPAEPPTPALLKGKGLMAHLRQTLPNARTASLLQTLFAHRSTTRLLPGAIVHLSLKRAPYNFSGVLMGVRHKGVDTSFVLRNVVQRTGVEMRFFVGSDNITDIRVTRKADGTDAKRERRAKLYYLRDNPARMNAISAGTRKQEAKRRAGGD